jgi:hypothetical protein
MSKECTEGVRVVLENSKDVLVRQYKLGRDLLVALEHVKSRDVPERGLIGKHAIKLGCQSIALHLDELDVFVGIHETLAEA